MALKPFTGELDPAPALQPFSGTLDGEKPKGFGSDVATALKQGVQQLPGALTGLADIPLGLAGLDRPVSRAAERLGQATGFEPGKWAEQTAQQYSPETQAARAEIDKAWEDPNAGALDVAGAYLRNPRATALNVVQSIPSIAAGGVAGRVVGGLAKVASAPARAAIGEGAVIAGQQMDQIDSSVDPQKAAAASLLAGAGGAAVGAAGGTLAARMGVRDIDTALAGGATAQAARTPGVVGRVATGALQEGGEEAAQSALEQGTQNWAENKPLTEGMARNVVEGSLAGGVMGAGAAAIPPSRRMGLDPNAGPLSAAAATAVDSGAVLALPAPTVTVDSTGTARTVDQRQAGRAPAGPAETGAMGQGRNSEQMPEAAFRPGDLPALLAPAIQVGPDGTATTTQQRQAAREQPAQPGPVETGAMGLGRNSEPLQPLDVPPQQPALTYDTAPSGTLLAGEDGTVRLETRAEAINRTQQQDAQRAADDAEAQRRIDLGLPPLTPIEPVRTTAPRGETLELGPDGVARPRDLLPEPTNRIRAGVLARQAGPGHEAVKVDGGWNVRRIEGAADGPTGEPGGLAAGGGAAGRGDAGRSLGNSGRAQPGAARPGVLPAPAGPVAGVQADLAARGDTGQPAAVAPRALPAPSTPLDQAAHAAATSPTNDLPEPTEAQKRAGNYAKGHLKLHGLDITIENPRGSTRSGTDPSGRPWSVDMPAHYGYVKRTTGADGDQVDVYIGEHPESQRVFVVDQRDADTGKFDEHKVILGARNALEARRLYNAGFSDGRGRERAAAVTPMTVPEFKAWLKDSDTTKPAAAAMAQAQQQEPPRATQAPQAQQPAATAARAEVPAAQPAGSAALAADPEAQQPAAASKPKLNRIQAARAARTAEPVEVSRDAGQRGEGMSEFRARQVRNQLALKNPGTTYSVEEDAGLKNGWVVVGRKAGAPTARAARTAEPDAPVSRAADQTATPEFRRWFGDSKVVNAEGKPLVVYHGTRADFDAFDTDSGRMGPAAWFTPNQRLASGHAKDGSVLPVYLAIKNPYIAKNGTEASLVTADRKAELIAQGYDGIYEKRGAIEQWVAFQPKQIKSATGNRGTFDPANPDITSRAADVPVEYSASVRAHRDAIEKAARQAASSWANKPRIVVAFDHRDAHVDQRVREHYSRPGKTTPAGSYYAGTVYLFTNRIEDSADGIRTLFHEALGHAGLRGVFGPRLHAVLDQVASARPALIAAKAKSYRLNTEVAADRRLAAEEVLAEMAEQNPQLPWVRRAVAAIRTWLRENVALFRNMRISDDEIVRNFLLPARGFIERGPASERVPSTTVPVASQGEPAANQGRGTTLPVANSKDVAGNTSGRPAGDESTAPTIRDIMAAWDALGIKNWLSEKNGEIELSRIEVPFAERKQGIGTKAMRMLTDYADATGQSIKLRASQDFGGNKQRLVNFYERFGFQRTGGAPNASARDTVMAREPVSNEPTAPNSDGAPLSRQASAAGSAARPGRASWNAPEPSKLDDFVYTMQDKHVDTKRVIDAIRKTGKQLADDADVYLQEELFHGRAAKRTEDFVTRELKPLLAAMTERGIEQAELDKYLHARHAEEANKLIAERNPDLKDGGSGMSTADARAYLAGLGAPRRAALDAVAKQVDAIIAGTRGLYAAYGLESAQTVKGWGDMFKHYVPLMREDHDGGMGIGQGFSIKGRESKGRVGSASAKVVDILANIAIQREKAIVRGEKNRVAQALVGLVEANPNPEFWQVGPPPAELRYNPDTNKVEERVDPMFKSRENVLVAKVVQPNGQVEERAVIFNADSPRAARMAKSLKNLDAAQMEGLLGVSAKITRYFAAINTQYNPIFGAVNLPRDVQGAIVNLSSTPLKDKRGEVLAGTLSALRGIYSEARAARDGKKSNSPWGPLWERFQQIGGQTGYRDLFRTSTDRADAIDAELNPTKWMDSPIGKIVSADGRLKVPLAFAQRRAAGVFNWLSDYNLAMENAVRLAAFKVALDTGMPEEQAASLAKNLTVNFNRKGQIGQQAGALFAFFNAAVQGTARIGQTLFTMEGGDVKTIRLSRAGQKIVAGGVLLGSMQALLLAGAGFDDEEPPDFVRERNLIIPTGGATYITIPMPLGLHVLPNIGRITTEFALGGFKKPQEHFAKMFGLTVDAFSPVGGGSGSLVQAISPTAIDPFVALSENKDFTGKPIAKESLNRAIPGHQLAKDTASTPAKMLAEAINHLSGGGDHARGVFSPTPDQIDYLWGQVTGGVGREISKAEQSLSATASGEELPPHKVPLLGRFYGNSDSQGAQAGRFYAALNRINEIETEVKGLRKDGRAEEAREVLTDNPEGRLMIAANRVERVVQKLRAQKRDLIAEDAPDDRVKAIEEQITARMTAFNETVKRLRAEPATQ